MPNHKSCEKRIKQDAKKRINNNYVKSTINTLSKKIKKTKPNKIELEKMVSELFSKLDKAAKRGVIHKRTASRRKARLSQFINKISTKK